ncbi:Gmad2 immunoglobulin-like domain-containing protein [Streptomyces sp. TRM76323]|uniref:Gmad2 immunoglobulin-like domain-containing protein n=1 Tax=Streptomyces tamarix TaxID=3078565 RepID=A0ABU3QNE7_9ACTN|nr:Gmad2 immunoglobulin-like domain-containing protein [Streptomyces tamarix]MDT9684028.1 Gmad2 immunoglobulin-like domain-containing protein [Streptomyces tamarix]
MAFRTRTTLAQARRSRSAPLASALVLALTLSACAAGTGGAVAPGDAPRTGSPAPADPATTAAPPPTSGAASPGRTTPPEPATPPPDTARPATSSATGKQVRVAVYFLHGGRVSPASRSVTAPATAAGALRALLSGPNGFERRHDRTTAIPAGTELRSLAVRDGVATVDLTGRYDDGGDTPALRTRLAQVVFTATRFPAVKSVRFALDGKPVSRFGGEGVDLTRPVGRADFEDLTPAVLVESPMIGDTVRSPVRVWGTANTFEAGFGLRLTDAAGRTAAKVHGMASSGNGTRGTFDLTVRFQATREGAGTLTASWDSPEDGRLVDSATVPVTLRR